MTDDYSYVAFGCENLQIGTNFIDVELYENSRIVNSIGSILYEGSAWVFEFLTENEGIVYSLELFVEEECTDLFLD